MWDIISTIILYLITAYILIWGNRELQLIWGQVHIFYVGLVFLSFIIILLIFLFEYLKKFLFKLFIRQIVYFKLKKFQMSLTFKKLIKQFKDKIFKKFKKLI
jgi:hypothetical protein